MPVQKQTRAGQRTRFKAIVVVGDGNGHIGLGVKCAKEVATAIRGAIILAKLSVIPVRRGYWGNRIGLPHTVPCKVCLIPNRVGIERKATFLFSSDSGNRFVWQRSRSFDSSTSRNKSCLRSSTKKTSSNGWYSRLLDSSERLYGNIRKFRCVQIKIQL